jgi:formylglycine-generating enzyme required for sulfatase activity
MSKKKKKEPTSPDEIEVTLKPIAGIQPWAYLTVVYIIIVLLILFLILLLPGIRKNGSIITFDSRPRQAAVYIDGKYAGATPFKTFVPRGSHTFTIEKPFFEEITWNEKTSGKLFFTLFAPKKVRIERTLTLENLEGYLSSVSQEYSSYALLDSLYVSYQVPRVLSHRVEALYNNAVPPPKDEIELLLRTAVRNVHNDVLLKDFLKAVSTYTAGGKVLTPNSLIDFVSYYLKAEDNKNGIDFLITAALPEQSRKEIHRSVWYNAAVDRYREAVITDREYIGQLQRIPENVGGVRFYVVPAGGYIKGLSPSGRDIDTLLGTQYHPHLVRVDQFYISEGEITKAQYARFIEASPQWAPSNRTTLIESGLVDGNYLNNWEDLNDGDPVSNISFFAAQEYCDWLTMQLPSSLSDYVVALPSESEWEYVARSQWEAAAPLFRDEGVMGPAPSREITESSSTLKQLRGNLWEWCRNWYYPAAYTAATIGPLTSIDSPAEHLYRGSEKALRGGSWANQTKEISYTTRGSQPPDWCTPFIGFRPVITQSQK